jgi:hypothetical protein
LGGEKGKTGKSHLFLGEKKVLEELWKVALGTIEVKIKSLNQTVQVSAVDQFLAASGRTWPATLGTEGGKWLGKVDGVWPRPERGKW